LFGTLSFDSVGSQTTPQSVKQLPREAKLD
jgi:hypothetical protein